MTASFLCTSDSVVFRKVADELIVIHLNTGQMCHFTSGTEEMLEFFKQPKRLESYLKAAEVESQDSEVEHIRNLAHFLVDQQILEARPVGEEVNPEFRVSYSRPGFVRFDDKTLDQIAFLYP